MPVVAREDGAEVFWEATGSGTPVLLLMGLAYPAAMWFRQVPALAERHRVIVMDNRGAGRTGDVPGAPYTVETMAADALAVLDAAGEESAHVVGISMGGLMAQELALSHRDRVRSLVLMASHPGIANAVVPPVAIELLQKRATMTADEAAEASIPFNYAPTTDRALIEEDWAVRMPLAASPAGYLAQGGTALWNRIADLPTVTTPTLVVHGALDALLPPANGERLADAIPDAKLVVVDDANHVLTTDQAERVNALLLEWFADRDGARP